MKRARFVMAAVVALCFSLFAPWQSVIGADVKADMLANLTKLVDASTAAAPEMKDFVKAKLLPLCTNPVFVKAITEQNAKAVPLDKIKQTDALWQKAEDELPIQKELMTNACAEEIRRLAKELGSLTETFVMDNQGANVGQNALTSDYWQGDEEKWTNSFNAGKGGIDIGQPKLDKSTNKVDQKISLPVIDETGKVIGAVCFGVSLK